MNPATRTMRALQIMCAATTMRRLVVVVDAFKELCAIYDEAFRCLTSLEADLVVELTKEDDEYEAKWTIKWYDLEYDTYVPKIKIARTKKPEEMFKERRLDRSVQEYSQQLLREFARNKFVEGTVMIVTVRFLGNAVDMIHSDDFDFDFGFDLN